MASQWIPNERDLWKIENFQHFLEARQVLLSEELNRRMTELLHGDLRAGPSALVEPTIPMGSGIGSEEEERSIQALNTWVEAQGLPRGVLSFEFADPTTGQQTAVFDLAWPNGLQEQRSDPVAVLLNEAAETMGLASQAGYRCFTDETEFKRYVQADILGQTA